MAKGSKRQVSIKRILELYGEKAAVAARQSLVENAEMLVQAAREICPVETGLYKERQYKLKHPGRLRDSIHVEAGKNKDTVLVVVDAEDDKGFSYAKIIEYGPRGKPFLKPAYEATKIAMINHSKDVIRAALQS